MLLMMIQLLVVVSVVVNLVVGSDTYSSGTAKFPLIINIVIEVGHTCHLDNTMFYGYVDKNIKFCFISDDEQVTITGTATTPVYYM
jgi:hypothetical protein